LRFQGVFGGPGPGERLAGVARPCGDIRPKFRGDHLNGPARISRAPEHDPRNRSITRLSLPR